MGKIKELYDTRVRSMPPADRLQLARLILDDLAPSETTVDVRDDWSDDDLAWVTLRSLWAASTLDSSGDRLTRDALHERR